MDDKKKLVSVLIITFNHERYIAQAIEGALMQKTNFDYEIVIGEDCSTDKTREIVLKYKETYQNKIKLVLQERNVGPNQNLLDTLSACTGKYIAICEGDDYWIDPYKLQKQVEFLEANPEYGLVYTGHNVIDSDENIIFVEDKQKPSGDIFFDLLRNSFITTCTVCLKASLVKLALNHALENKLKCVFDYWLWLYITMHSKAYYIKDITSAYRSHQNGVSKQGAKFFGDIIPLALLDALSYKINNLPEKQFFKRWEIYVNFSRALLSSRISFKDRLSYSTYLIKKPIYLLSIFNAFYRKLRYKFKKMIGVFF